jgi:5-methylcytosine-specific restriction protein A
MGKKSVKTKNEEIRLIATMEELIKNIKTFDNYLQRGTIEQQEWAIQRLNRGLCFVVYKVKNESRFAPSRF